MTERIALLTWNRPKLVLGMVALFMVAAVLGAAGSRST